MKCSKCEGEMVEGLLIDHFGGGYKKMRWAERLKSGWDAFFAKGENEIEVKSYRCKECGYLENYAKQ